jgi:hypothetical protein
VTTHPHPTIPKPAAPIVVRTHSSSRDRRVVPDRRWGGVVLPDVGPTLPVIGLLDDAPDEGTRSGAAYIARLDRIMRIA